MKMKPKTRRWLIISAVALFVMVNLLLVWLDEEDIEQKSYIQQWEQAFEEDLFNEVLGEGKFKSSTQNHVYFDEDIGSFNKFLVEEGDEVEAGDPLYEYIVRDYQENITRLETEVSSLEGEVAALEDYLRRVERIVIPEPEEEDQPPFVDAQLAKEQRIAQVEAQLAQKEAQLLAAESQLSDLNNRDEIVQVGSPFAGTVTRAAESLEEPVITLEESELVVSGLVDEGVRNDIQEGMKVVGTVQTEDFTWEGTVSRLAEYPEKEVDQVSQYPVEVEVPELAEGIHAGYHTTISFITAEANNVVTTEIGWIQERLEELEPLTEEQNASDESETKDQRFEQEDPTPFKKQRFVWTMNKDGRTVTQPIELGLTMRDLVEVTEGLEVGQWIADENEERFREGSLFLTPVNWDHLAFESIRSFDKRTMWDFLKMGLLVR